MSQPELAALVATYGYWALALGSLIEGESLLLLAGFAASRHHLSLPWVIAIAAAAGFVGDQISFWLGRYRGAALLARFPSVARQVPRVYRLVERWDAAAAFGVRFVYGLRLAGPAILGTSRIAAARFAAFNALGAVVWAALFATLGWLCGAAFEALLGDLHRIEVALFAVLACAGAAAAVLRWRRRRSAG